jgi:1,4-alpha-glucan branching enzyme
VVDFTYHAPDAARVQVAGDFSDWKPIALDQTDGRWSARLTLAPGRYTYMYVVDGRWTTDPKAHSFRDDEYGRRNAVLHL